MVCRRTYILPGILLSSFFFSELAERNSTTIGHMVGSQCNLETNVRNLGYLFPLQIGGQKPLFGWLPNKFNGLYLRNGTRCRQSVKCVDNYEGSPTSRQHEGSPTLSKNFMNFGPQTAKTGPDFLPIITILFCLSPSHTLYPASAGLPTATLNETALGSSATQICSSNAIASGGLKWQYIAIIATFSSCDCVTICVPSKL